MYTPSTSAWTLLLLFHSFPCLPFDTLIFIFLTNGCCLLFHHAITTLLLRTGMFSLFLWYDHLSKHSVCFKWQSHQDRRKWGDRSPENKVRKLSHCVLTYCSENVTKLAIMSKNFYENYTLVSSLYIKYFRELFRFFKVHNTDKLSPEILHSIHNLMQV